MEEKWKYYYLYQIMRDCFIYFHFGGIILTVEIINEYQKNNPYCQLHEKVSNCEFPCNPFPNDFVNNLSSIE